MNCVKQIRRGSRRSAGVRHSCNSESVVSMCASMSSATNCSRAKIRSDAVDYRYAHLSGADVELSSIALPDDCADRCVALARAARLPLAGIDFRRTDDGEWYCFEINPSPGFTYYQQATGAPIAAAIARLLAKSR